MNKTILAQVIAGVLSKKSSDSYQLPKEYRLETYVSSVTDLGNGVKIGRHKTLPGSVLEFDMFGKIVGLFVADSEYRTKLQFGTYGTDVPSLTNFTNQSKSNGWYLSSDLRGQTDNPPTVSIAKLQDEWSGLSTDKTARENCDIWMSYNSSTDSQSIKGVPAVAHCRSLTNIISGGCDLPNEFELMVIFLCMNQIDALDPTITSNPNYALGNVKGVSSKRWNFNGANYAWSSTEYSSNSVRFVHYNGDCLNDTKRNTRGVVPVRELYIYDSKILTAIPEFLNIVDQNTITVTPSGRLLARHISGKANVLQYNYQTMDKVLVVADAAYRKRADTKWRNTNTVVNGLFQFNSWSKVTSNGNNYIYQQDVNGVPTYVEGSTATLNVNQYAALGPVSDADLNLYLAPLYENEPKTARECGDICISEDSLTNFPALQYCRSLTDIVADGMDNPLMHDLFVLFVESDAIDAIDPTVAANPTKILGKGSNSNRLMNQNYVWSAQQYNSSFALYMNCYGEVECTNKKDAYSVLPVYEAYVGYSSSTPEIVKELPVSFRNHVDLNTVIKTPSGRYIGRDLGGKGSIINFNITDGTTVFKNVNLFVPDAAYRPTSTYKWQTTAKDLSLYNHETYYTGTKYIYNTGNVFISGDTSGVNVSSLNSLEPVTDEQLFERFGVTYTNETATYSARAMTDIIIAGGNTPVAANTARAITNAYPKGITTGGLDLPTALELLVMYVEGDYIDSLDPTLSANSTRALGKYTNSTRCMSAKSILSCQEYGSSYELCMQWNGSLTHGNKVSALAVLPVAEFYTYITHLTTSFTAMEVGSSYETINIKFANIKTLTVQSTGNITVSFATSSGYSKTISKDVSDTTSLLVYTKNSSGTGTITISATEMMSGHTSEIPENVVISVTYKNSCFTGDTLVWTESGMTRFDELKPGTRVWSKNLETEELELQPITTIMIHEPRRITTLISTDKLEPIETTAEHPFYSATLGKFTRVANLLVGDELLMADGSRTKITDIKEIEHEPRYVYNFEISVTHCAFVGIAKQSENTENLRGGGCLYTTNSAKPSWNIDSQQNQSELAGVLIHNKFSIQ